MTKCKKCGSQCLGNKAIKTCNNCDPHISKLIRDVASYEITEDDELVMGVLSEAISKYNTQIIMPMKIEHLLARKINAHEQHQSKPDRPGSAVGPATPRWRG